MMNPPMMKNVATPRKFRMDIPGDAIVRMIEDYCERLERPQDLNVSDQTWFQRQFPFCAATIITAPSLAGRFGPSSQLEDSPRLGVPPRNPFRFPQSFTGTPSVRQLDIDTIDKPT
jgi:hypothetical protein